MGVTIENLLETENNEKENCQPLHQLLVTFWIVTLSKN